jgi:hypothetical protein
MRRTMRATPECKISQRLQQGRISTRQLRGGLQSQMRIGAIPSFEQNLHKFDVNWRDDVSLMCDLRQIGGSWAACPRHCFSSMSLSHSEKRGHAHKG